jgi:transcriptional regulator with GAF, ATPase, and Fis domain
MLSEEEAINIILQGTVSDTGQAFFDALAKTMSTALGYSHTWITEIAGSHKLHTLALFVEDELKENVTYDMRGTPCETVIVEKAVEHHADNVQTFYPQDKKLSELNARSYFGVPMIGSKGDVVGHLALLGKKPSSSEPNGLAVLKTFASRAGAELERIYIERQLKKQQEETQKILDTAMDCIITLETDLSILTVNQSVLTQFEVSKVSIEKQNFASYMDATSAKHLNNALKILLSKQNDEQRIWLPDSLKLIKQADQHIIADATVSLIEKEHGPIIVLSFRNVNDRIQGLKRIESLDQERQYLKSELKRISENNKIIGSSPAMLAVLEEIEQVAQTEASVLICGETGTGKELVANALHQSSKRKDKAFVKVNCGALQANLIESEFFGHEKGAFSGAVNRRLGRFQLADGGTIFLDEVGDIPADLQVKLLRVLQEGEFESVGSSTTQKVNVRVIAATHRDLLQAVQDGEFREDLYYRLNVFPIMVPALRERGDDITAIAQTFKDHFCHQIGRCIDDFTPLQIQQLKSHYWPGNIRELRNVIERAVITSKHGTLNLDRALPSISIEKNEDSSAHSMINTPRQTEPPLKSDAVAFKHINENTEILNEAQLKEIEKNNIIRAIALCNGKISGEKGAAKLLGLKPSTLSSRMKTYDIDYDNS